MRYPTDISRVLGYIEFALKQNDTDAWCLVFSVFANSLTEEQRAGLAFVSLRSAKKKTAQKIAKIVVGEMVGPPMAPLFSHMDEAAFWADLAEPEAIEVYCLTCYQNMPLPRQAAFLAFVQDRVAA